MFKPFPVVLYPEGGVPAGYAIANLTHDLAPLFGRPEPRWSPHPSDVCGSGPRECSRPERSVRNDEGLKRGGNRTRGVVRLIMTLVRIVGAKFAVGRLASDGGAVSKGCKVAVLHRPSLS